MLDLQGDVREHVAALAEVGVASRLVKRPADLAGLAGLILPGGESTTLSMLLTSTGLFDPVAGLLDEGFPVLGTCAGLVLLAREVLDGRPDQRSFGAVDAVVRRNGFGRQVASFETRLEFGEGPPLPAVFIRAPYVVSVGPGSTCWRPCGTGAQWGGRGVSGAGPPGRRAGLVLPSRTDRRPPGAPALRGDVLGPMTRCHRELCPIPRLPESVLLEERDRLRRRRCGSSLRSCSGWWFWGC